MQKRKPGRYTALIIVFGVLAIVLYRSGNFGGKTNTADLDRNPTQIIYSKHARCRMDCRKISEEEVKKILKEGRINYGKSSPARKPEAQFALEGNTLDGQDLRIVFAVSPGKAVVVTVIDLKKEWPCHCQ